MRTVLKVCLLRFSITLSSLLCKIHTHTHTHFIGSWLDTKTKNQQIDPQSFAAIGLWYLVLDRKRKNNSKWKGNGFQLHLCSIQKAIFRLQRIDQHFKSSHFIHHILSLIMFNLYLVFNVIIFTFDNNFVWTLFFNLKSWFTFLDFSLILFSI